MNLTETMIDDIQAAFEMIDSEWGPQNKAERVRWGDIMRVLGRKGYKNWWYPRTNSISSIATEQKWY